MDRRAMCGMLACCVLVAHTAALGHAHAVGAPAGHDLRPHFHLAGGHSHTPSSGFGGLLHHRHPHAGHSHGGHGHVERSHEAAPQDQESPATADTEAPKGKTPVGAGWRDPAGEHDDDAFYLAVAACGTDLGRKAFLKSVGFDGFPAAFLPADSFLLAARDRGGALRFRRPPRDGCAQVARYLLNHAFRC